MLSVKCRYVKWRISFIAVLSENFKKVKIVQV
jgi:hypothetical protein